jgi:hypothetical protein
MTREARRRQGTAIKRHTQLLHSLLVQSFYKIKEHGIAGSSPRIDGIVTGTGADRRRVVRSGERDAAEGVAAAAACCGITSSTPRARRRGDPWSLLQVRGHEPVEEHVRRSSASAV